MWMRAGCQDVDEAGARMWMRQEGMWMRQEASIWIRQEAMWMRQEARMWMRQEPGCE
jgi:hypothetical protein